MSVKDRIAMWNTMANSNKNTPPSYPAPKPNFKTTFSATENTQPLKNDKSTQTKTDNKTFVVETQSIMKPSTIKKQDTIANKNNAYNRFSTPVTSLSSTPSSEEIMTPSQLKKLMASGQAPCFIVPQQPAPRAPINKPITQVPQTFSTNYTSNFDIDKDIPVVNVKQNAKRLSQFYKNQAELQAKKAEELKNAQTQNTQNAQVPKEQTNLTRITQQSNQNHQSKQDNNAITESEQSEPLVKYEQSGNISLNYQPTQQTPQNKQKPQQIYHNTNFDMAAVLRSKKRMTRPKFNDSDQD